jgi:hypothetical protein
VVAVDKGKLFLSILTCIKELMNKCYNEKMIKTLKDIIFLILSQLIDHDSNTVFYIITMTLNLKPYATSKEMITFCLCGSIGLFAIARNIIRMHRYHKMFRSVGEALQKYRHNFAEI